MPEIKVSIVSYLNSKPFVYGLKHAALIKDILLSEDIPSDCARKLIEEEVQLGLVPATVIPLVPNARIIADYCIGAVGEVDSVFVFSNQPVDELHTIYLDRHSRTSNNLARVLARHYWKVSPEFKTRTEDFIELKAGEGMVLIGDRTFGQKGKYAYVYDLSGEWMKLTGLPFVFAAWVANTDLPSSFITSFNEALKDGLDHRQEVISFEKRADFDVADYLLHKLDYTLDAEKRKGLELYLLYCASL